MVTRRSNTNTNIWRFVNDFMANCTVFSYTPLTSLLLVSPPTIDAIVSTYIYLKNCLVARFFAIHTNYKLKAWLYGAQGQKQRLKGPVRRCMIPQPRLLLYPGIQGTHFRRPTVQPVFAGIPKLLKKAVPRPLNLFRAPPCPRVVKYLRELSCRFLRIFV